MRWLTYASWCALAISACANAEDLGGDGNDSGLYQAPTATAGQANYPPARGGTGPIQPGGAGGVAGVAGWVATGGMPIVPSDASSGAGAALGDANSACPDGQKICGGICVAPNPGIGCGPTGCEPCALAPEGGYRTCEGTSCSFECNSGFERSADGTVCVGLTVGGGMTGSGGSTGGAPSSGGGPNPGDAAATGGSPASGGSPGGCVPSSCTVPGPWATPCCLSTGQCGCGYAGGAVCSPC